MNSLENTPYYLDWLCECARVPKLNTAYTFKLSLIRGCHDAIDVNNTSLALSDKVYIFS